MRHSLVGLLFFIVSLGFVTLEVEASTSTENRVTCSNPAHAVVSYSALRGISGQAGKTAEVTGAKVAGCFAWSSNDPNGYGDDGGIVIASNSGGFWVRQWSYSPDMPIELDWFQLANGVNVRQLIDRLATSYSPHFYIRMPTQSLTLHVNGYWDFTCNGHSITRLRFLESSAKVTLKQTVFDKHSPYMMVLGSSDNTASNCGLAMSDVVIGTDRDKNDRDAYNLWFDGGVDGPCKECHSARGIVHFRAEATGDIDAQFRYNVKDALSSGLHVQGGVGSVPTIHVSGRYESAWLRASNVHVVIDDTLYTSDPYARNWGWTGQVQNGVALMDYNGSRYGGGAYGSHQIGNSFVRLESLRGAIYSDYNNAPWGIFVTEYVGEEGRPFTFISKNAGFLGDGTPVEPPNVVSHWGKSDPLAYPGSEPTPGRRFLKFINDGSDHGDNLLFQNGIALEATDETCKTPNPSGILWHNTYVDMTLVNLKGNRVNTGVNLYCGGNNDGLSAYNTFRGNGSDPAMLDDVIMVHGHNHTIRDGVWNGIHVRRSNYYAHNTQYMPCHDNIIKDVKVTWNIHVESGCHGTTLSNIEWLRGARKVLEIGAHTSVTATNLKAPVGSTVEGQGTLILNGKQVSLPYTFDGSEGTGSSGSNNSPVAHGQSVTLKEGETKSIVLKGSDADGDAISYSIADQPSHGTLSGAAPNVSYAPHAGYSGSDSFTFTVHDGTATSNKATVSISVQPTPVVENEMRKQHVELAQGWNSVSLHVQPEEASMSSVFSAAGEKIVLVKNEDGSIYYPSEGIDELGSWQFEEAYYVYANGTTLLSVEGEPIPATTPIALQVGWNFVPFLLDREVPIEEGFRSIKSDLVMAKDEEGHTYIPDMGIAEFAMLIPGDGYQVYVERPTTLVYGSEPLSMWSFEGTGTAALDAYGDHHGTIHGATRTPSGFSGQALAFDGVDDYVDLGNLDITAAEMTLSAWFNADDLDNQYARILSKANGSSNDQHWWMLGMIDVDGAPRLRFRIKTEDGVTTPLVGSQVIPAQQWIHVAATYDGSTMRIFINGDPAGSVSKTGSIASDPSVPVYVGTNPAGDKRYHFHGRIDEIRIYDRALLPDEIRTLSEGEDSGV